MTTVFQRAHIVSPDVDVPDASLVVKDGVIAALYLPGEAIPKSALEPVYGPVEYIDLGGDLLLPGFFDIHTHGCANHDFCDATQEAMAAMARHKLTQGVTSFLGTTLTLPEERLDVVFAHAQMFQRENHDGADLPAIHLEGPFIAPDCAGAQNPDYLRQPDIDMVDRLASWFPISKASYSIELDHDLSFVRQLVERGIMPAVAHSQATYEQFTQSRLLGMRHMSHFCNVMSPLHHLNFGLVGGGMLHKDMFVELICDGVHLCPEMIQLLFEVIGCERIMLITDSMRAAGMPDGDYELGGLPVTVRDGCARIANGRVAGSTLLFHQGLQRVRRLTQLPLAQLVKTTAWNQARSLGFSDRGKIEPGFRADLVRMSADLEPKQVWVAGQKRL